jgi:hypothetical protein
MVLAEVSTADGTIASTNDKDLFRTRPSVQSVNQISEAPLRQQQNRNLMSGEVAGLRSLALNTGFDLAQHRLLRALRGAVAEQVPNQHTRRRSGIGPLTNLETIARQRVSIH